MDEPLASLACAHPWVIVGCGYTGTHLARRLARAGAKVIAARRSWHERPSPDASVERRVCDLENPESLSGLLAEGAVVVHSVPPRASGTRGDVAIVRAAIEADVHRIVYVSSTGVYAPADGAWVDEDGQLGPMGPRGAARLEAETALLDAAAEAGVDAVSLRVSGIYGPDRGVVARMQAGTYRIIGDGDTFVSRIHVHDLCTAIIAAGVVSPLPRRVYNVADDAPTTSTRYAEEVARALGLDAPPHVPISEVPESVAAMLTANRRIANGRMKDELGVELEYPSYRDALAELAAVPA